MNRFFKDVNQNLLQQTEDLQANKKEIDAENLRVLEIVSLAFLLVFGLSFITSFFSDLFIRAELDAVRWSYIAIIIFCGLFFIRVHFYKMKNVLRMTYIFNTVAILYSIVICSFITPDAVSVNFIVVLFMIATLYTDKSVNINLYIITSTVIYLIVAYLFKTEISFYAEFVHITTVAALAMVIGGIVRQDRLSNITRKTAMEKQATTDQLTGIANRRKLYQDLARVEAKESQERIFAVAMLDIDYFKNYNDTYGHQKGDDCLYKIGQCFLALQRNYNVKFYRYGGEEFVMLFLSKDEIKLNLLLQEFNELIKVLKIPHRESPYQRVTFSIGVTLYNPGYEEHYEGMLTHADQALYLSKENGRNQTTYYSS